MKTNPSSSKKTNVANVFLKQLDLKIDNFKCPFFKNFQTHEMVYQTIGFKKQQKHQAYLNGLNEDQLLVDMKARKEKKLKPQVTLMNQWIKNTIVYPAEINIEFDCQDKFNLLKNFSTITEELDAKEQNVKVANLSGSTSPVLMKPYSDGPLEPVGKQMVLVVDDSEFMQKTIELLLKKEGVEFEIASNG